MDFAVPADHKVKPKENKKKNKYLDLFLGTEKAVEHESDGDTNCNWSSWYSHQWIDTGTEGLRNKRANGDI